MTDSTNTTIASNGQAAPPAVPMGLRHKLEETVDRLLTLLDAMDAPEEGLEPQGDVEPSLGWPEPGTRCQSSRNLGASEDREDDCEDEGAQCEDEGCTTTDDEPSLGWTLDGNLGNDSYGEDRESDPADMGEPEDAF